MDKENIIELLNKIARAEEGIKSLKGISLAFLNTYKSIDAEMIKSILLCYYRILGQTEEDLSKCSEMIGDIE